MLCDGVSNWLGLIDHIVSNLRSSEISPLSANEKGSIKCCFWVTLIKLHCVTHA